MHLNGKQISILKVHKTKGPSSMINFLFLLVSFVASIVGSICGIGGGVIIKPVLDSFGILDVKTISFLAGCTVLSMSTYSVIMTKLKNESHVNMKFAAPLAIGGAIGGIIGKKMFQSLIIAYNQNLVGGTQAGILIVITLGTLIYTLYKNKIQTHRVTNILISLVVGLFLGIISSFLGIGGGPINLVVLFFFFSMPTKVAAQNSLFIILFSQLTSLLSTLITHTVPNFDILLLLLMIFGGVLGGYYGRKINNTIEEKRVEHLFIGIMGVIILINIFNMIKFLA